MNDWVVETPSFEEYLMNRNLMITKQDLIDWIDRPPSNNDLDLAIFISTRLEKFYDLEQKLQQKENIIKEVREYILSNQNTELSVDSYFKYKDLVEFNDILEILDKVN